MAYLPGKPLTVKTGKGIITGFLLFATLAGFSQQRDTISKKLDSLSKKTDSGQINNTNPEVYREAKLDFKTYFILLGSDLKQSFTKPFHMKSRDWKYLGGAVLVTAGLTLVDKPVQQYALRLRNEHPALRNTSKYITNFGGSYEFYTLAAFGAYGFIFKNEKMKNTTLLASQAYITGAAVESVVKFISGRTRPSFYSPNTIAQPTFKGPFAKSIDYTGARTNSSFPSGHATVAFAAATVFALEYKNRPWIPIFAYSAATLIGLSRITENKHWGTDVLVGAALGYLTGRQVVNNYHRYAKLKAPNQQKSLSFNLQYNFGQVMPGLVYKF
jgi:membrane-associated phospholipid phosphatase